MEEELIVFTYFVAVLVGIISAVPTSRRHCASLYLRARHEILRFFLNGRRGIKSTKNRAQSLRDDGAAPKGMEAVLFDYGILSCSGFRRKWMSREIPDVCSSAPTACY